MTRRKGGPGFRAALSLLAFGAVAAILIAFTRRFERYAVSGASMAPTLLPGDWVVVDRAAYRVRPPAPGHVVLALDPRSPARELVKRVVVYDPLDGAWIEGDNPAASTDSRVFGPIPPVGILGRVRWRYWPLVR